MARAKLTAFVGLNSGGFRRGLRAMRRRWNAFKRNVVGPMARFGKMVGRNFLRGGIMIGAALVGAIKHANDFRREMANVNTMLDGQDLEQYSEGILKMAGRFGMAKNSLTKGLYDILSAGIAAKSGLEVLEVATRAAIGGATDTAVAVDALTTVLNAYSMDASEAGHVSDVLFQIVRDGKITYAELAENIGKIAPTAKAAGLSLEQLGAAIATIVKTEKPERAMTSLRQAMFQAAEDGQNLFDLAKRFKGASLEDVISAGINKKTAAGVVILANNFKVLMSEIQKFQNVSGRAGEAFEKLDKVRHWQKLWQTVLSIITRVGVVLDESLAPAITSLTDKLAKLVDTPGFKKFLEQVREAAETITGAMVGLARGGKGRELAMKGFKLLIVGIFQSAGNKLITMLMKNAPWIGAAIGKGFAAIALSPIKTKAQKFEAMRAARKETGEGRAQAVAGRFGFGSAKFKSAFQRHLETIQEADLREQADKINKQFAGKLVSGADKVKAGMELLRQASEEATKDLKAFKSEVKKTTTEKVFAKGGEPDVFTKDTGVKGTEFSSLRKIGANILTGAGPGPAGPQKTRIQILREQKETNKWLKEIQHTAKLIILGEWAGDDSATF